jgi:hypothetical protein
MINAVISTRQIIMSSPRATSNQFSWRQFTERERDQREKNEMLTSGRGRLHSSKEPEDYIEVEVKTPRRSTRNSAKSVVESEVAKKPTKKVTITVTKSIQTIIPPQPFENVQPVRTRSQKRLADAADAMVQLQQASLGIPQSQTPREKTERRSDYWVKRDDKRRQSARLLKIQKQQLH